MCVSSFYNNISKQLNPRLYLVIFSATCTTTSIVWQRFAEPKTSPPTNLNIQQPISPRLVIWCKRLQIYMVSNSDYISFTIKMKFDFIQMGAVNIFLHLKAVQCFKYLTLTNWVACTFLVITLNILTDICTVLYYSCGNSPIINPLVLFYLWSYCRL